VDCVAVYDTRYTSGSPSTWDNTVSSGGHLEDPKLYPEATTINLGDPPISVQSPVTELSISSSWNDTSNQQKFNVEGTITNNSQAASGSFTATKDISASTTLSRYSSGSASTPTVGDLGHEINSLEYTTGTSEIAEIAGIDALDLVSYAGPGSLSPGTQLNESGILDSNGDLLSISNLSFTAESDLTLAVTETLELSRAPLPVNESDFDVGLVSLTSSSASGTDYQVAITGTSTSI